MTRPADDIELLREIAGTLPIVIARPDVLPAVILDGQDGRALVRDDDLLTVVAAAGAAARGLAVIQPDAEGTADFLDAAADAETE